VRHGERDGEQHVAEAARPLAAAQPPTERGERHRTEGAEGHAGGGAERHGAHRPGDERADAHEDEHAATSTVP
jgi:hypothetical protein